MREEAIQITEEQKINSMADNVAENYLANILKRVSSKELADKKELELMEKIDNKEITIQQACLEAIKFIKLRQAAINGMGIESDKPLNQETIEERAIFVKNIKLSEFTPDCFLGNGAVAEVYSLVDGDKKFCAKMIKNHEKYGQENNIYQEADFLNDLKHFSNNGVRTPHLECVISSVDMKVIVMEELNAVNIARVIEGLDELPSSFNLEDFIKRLTSYIMALHAEKGIYHLDLAARNIMADKDTGLPYVIDFGKSKFKRDFIGEKAGNFEDIYISKDLGGVELVRAEIKRWMDGDRKPFIKKRHF